MLQEDAPHREYRSCIPEYQTDVAVVGAGAAGLYTAICASRHGAAVTLVSATALAESSTYWAQGGLAAALAADDSVELHIEDTIVAGRGAVRESAARVLCAEAPQVVVDLQLLGVVFDTDSNGELALGLEGGHTARRVVHAGGAATGQQLIERLSMLAAEDPQIDVQEAHRAVSLLVRGDRCAGVLLEDGRQIRSAATVLATGGAAALWERTTNPPGAVGGGLLLAAGAGAVLADLEMTQFHPTAVAARDGADGFLVTEAIRGEGAHLLDAHGERFVDELAPRDEVARAIQRRMAQTRKRSVSLDMRNVNPALFPNIVATLRRGGIDPVTELIPVSPAAHYMMGGIATDLDARSSLPGLYAVGECSCTGVHGANRLASNSLTECFVFGARAAHSAAEDADSTPADDGAEPEVRPPLGGRQPRRTARASRRALWRKAGLQRSLEGLTELADDPHPLAALIARSALLREESRGAHERTDFPELNERFDRQHVEVSGEAEPVLRRWD
jgi:L-aspartate oxidase